MRWIGIFIFLLIYSGTTKADLPLNIEGLLTDRGEFKLEFGTAYANNNRSGISAGELITIQIGPTQFISLPTSIGESRINSDIIIPNIGLRYGLSADAEVYGKATWIAEYSRSQGESGEASNSYSNFNDAWIGLNYRFLRDEKFPALLGFTELALAEKNNHSAIYGRSLSVGATVYRAIDPVVLSLTTAFLHRGRRDIGGNSTIPGSIFIINPQVSFAVNEAVTLSTGLTWRSQAAEKINGMRQGQRNTSSTLNLGLAYLWNKNTILNLTSRSDVSGKGGTEIGLSVQIKLGDLFPARHVKSAQSSTPN
ncbi:hypothetical protein [Cupriavidus sp. YAF13]|uniref:hypothetical protein n=1 Tax=Cupriavidus sp. YAF13 TaxID=3233075 RepID=UPI003F934717